MAGLLNFEVPGGMSLWDYVKQRANDPLVPPPTSRMIQNEWINKGMEAIGLAPLGITKYEQALEAARKNGVKMLGLPENNTPMDRARALGAIDMYHGSADDIVKIDPSKYGSATGATSAKQGFWGVSDPKTAGGYAEYAATGAPVKRLMNDADTFERIAQKNTGAYSQKYWDKYDDALQKAEQLERDLYNQPLRGQNIMPLKVIPKKQAVMNANGAEFVDVEGGVNSFIRDAKRNGIDLAIFKNMADDVGMNNRPADHFVALDPSIVRSRFAAFDPARINENDLLAGIAPYLGIGGLLGLGYYGDNNGLQER